MHLLLYSCVAEERFAASYLVFLSFSHLFISKTVKIFIDILYTKAIETERNKKDLLCHCVPFFYPKGKFGFMEFIFQCSTSRLHSHYVLKAITNFVTGLKKKKILTRYEINGEIYCSAITEPLKKEENNSPFILFCNCHLCLCK